jgi:hypothetical protein
MAALEKVKTYGKLLAQAPAVIKMAARGASSREQAEHDAARIAPLHEKLQRKD